MIGSFLLDLLACKIKDMLSKNLWPNLFAQLLTKVLVITLHQLSLHIEIKTLLQSLLSSHI